MSQNHRLAPGAVLTAVILLVLTSLGDAVAPSATVTSVRGTVLVHRIEDGPPIPAQSGTSLQPGDKVEAQSQSRATILLPWGAIKILRSGQSFLIPSKAPSSSRPGLLPLSQNVATVFLASREKTSKMEKLDIRAGTRSAEGGEDRVILLSPRNTAIVKPRPTFVWSTHPGAMTYRITIIGVQGRVLEATSSTASFTYGADAPSLQPGSTYFWEVVAVTPTVKIPSGKAHFTILSPDDRAAVRTLVGQIRKASFPDPEDSSPNYLLAHIYLDKGLYERAARVLLRAARMNPHDQGHLDLLMGIYREMQLDSRGIALFQDLL